MSGSRAGSPDGDERGRRLLPWRSRLITIARESVPPNKSAVAADRQGRREASLHGKRRAAQRDRRRGVAPHVLQVARRACSRRGIGRGEPAWGGDPLQTARRNLPDVGVAIVQSLHEAVVAR